MEGLGEVNGAWKFLFLVGKMGFNPLVLGFISNTKLY